MINNNNILNRSREWITVGRANSEIIANLFRQSRTETVKYAREQVRERSNRRVYRRSCRYRRAEEDSVREFPAFF